MLRQSKLAVQALHEVEVLTTDYVGEDTDLHRCSASNPVTVRTILRGRLHIRTGNIGKKLKTFLSLRVHEMSIIGYIHLYRKYL